MSQERNDVLTQMTEPEPIEVESSEAEQTEVAPKPDDYAVQCAQLIGRLGITLRYKGYQFICHAVKMSMEDPAALMSVTKIIYPAVAQEFRTTSSAVERNIRTAVSVCWNFGNRRLLNQVAGYTLHNRPTSAEFISILVAALKYQKNL